MVAGQMYCSTIVAVLSKYVTDTLFQNQFIYFAIPGRTTPSVAYGLFMKSEERFIVLYCR